MSIFTEDDWADLKREEMMADVADDYDDEEYERDDSLRFELERYWNE